MEGLGRRVSALGNCGAAKGPWSGVPLLALLLCATACPPEPPPPKPPTVVAVGSSAPRPAMVPVGETAPPAEAPRRALFEILPVDDSLEPLRGTVPPAGVSLRMEQVAIAPGTFETRHYAVLARVAQSGLWVSLKPSRAWFDRIEKALPNGRRLAWQPVFEERAGAAEPYTGWRTLVVQVEPIVTSEDVVSAEMAEPEDSGSRAVLVRLRHDGAERFREFTRTHVKRRLAIVIEGVVSSAPVIHEEIAGGRIHISFPGGLGEQRQAAERLIKELRAARH